MRRLVALVALALLLAGCAPTAASAPEAAGAVPPPVLLNEGGVLRPIQLGQRVAIKGGSATVMFSPLSLERSDLDLDVTVLDRSGRPVEAGVQVSYDMVDMHHGTRTQRAVAHEGRYRMPIWLSMPGAWQFTIRIERDGDATTLVIVVPRIV